MYADMANFKELLPKINTFIFDIDGVITDGTIIPFGDNQQLRRMNIKDGYALQHAIKRGYNVAVISGGSSVLVKNRLHQLGIKDVFLKASDKLPVLNQYIKQKGLDVAQILYMGDDIPDYHAMKTCGVATCPKNAAIEIKEIAHYISNKDGGKGCVRDIVEQVLRCNGDWFTADAHEW